MPGCNERVKELFQQAAELEEEERGGFLESACGGDPDLKRQVETLLLSLAESERFFPEPTARPHEEERPGLTIDRYKLLQAIGEGGFGVVWMAEQTEPIRRRVALKVIKLGMDTKQVVARFEAERQALAMMDHPNIAKVLDGGATTSGRPYFAMELVRGVPITEYCDQANLGPRERIELFRRVCHAVQHAHQKGVIHRDLKPNNILVTLHDGIPVPKVIDFGVAKATSQELTQKTLFTEFRQIVGTPEFMAPEQAELSGLDVDTRADIYSLGVVLYELLTGTRPFDLESIADKGYVEMLRHIREVEPQKPSTRLNTLGEMLPAVARQRQTEPHKLGQMVRGDLDWIVMKALEKDRSRRYPTANSLADDLQRHLEDRPVEAGRPSAIYRLTKLVHRNRLFVAAALVIFALLLAGALGIAISWNRALVAEDVAKAEADRVVLEANRAELVIQLIQDMLGAADPHSIKGPDFTVRELLDEFDRGLGVRLQQEPSVEADIRTTMGIAYRSLGIETKAEFHLREAMRLREREFGVDHEVYGKSLADWAWTLHERGDYVQAQETMVRSLEIARRTDTPPEDLADRLYGLGDFYRHNGGYAEAEASVRESLELQDRVGTNPDALGPSLNILGLTLQDRGRYGEAEEVFRKVLELRRVQYGPDHLHVASALNSMGSILTRLGRYADAEHHHRESLAIRQKRLGEQHVHVGISMNNLAAALREQGRHEEAETFFRGALERFRGSFGEEHVYVTHTLANLASVLTRQGRLPEAEEMLRDALDRLRKIYGPVHIEIARSTNKLAWNLREQGRQKEAEGLYRDSLAMFRKLVGDRHPSVAMAIANLATAVSLQDRHGEAEGLFREALGQVRDLLDESHPSLQFVLKGLGSAILAQERHAEAEPFLLEAYEKAEAQGRVRPRLIEEIVKLYEQWCEAGEDRADELTRWRAELERIRAEGGIAKD